MTVSEATTKLFHIQRTEYRLKLKNAFVRIERDTLRNDGTRCARRCDGRTERGHYHIEYREECKAPQIG